MTNHELLDAIVELSVEAGEAILEVYRADDAGIEYKDDDSPLTRADLASHRVLADGLARLTPDIPVLSEEAAETHGDGRLAWDRLWVVDPLDGTKEFIKKNGEFTVNVALVDRGELVLGVVHAPDLGRTYAGIVGDGAWRQDGEDARQPIDATGAGPLPLRIVASRSHQSPELLALLGRLPEHELVSIGSSLKICLVAEGAAACYPRLGPTREWDVAAGHAVLGAAGGRLVDLRGREFTYNRPDLLNSSFVAEGRSTVPWREALPDA